MSNREETAVSNAPRKLDRDRIRQVLAEWFNTKKKTVRFIEEADPRPDRHARYTVAYEAIFVPLH